jgi:hypothetical protein
MHFLSHIPRGLAIFIAALVVIIAVVAGYKFLAGGVSNVSTGTSGNNLFSALFPFGNSGSNTTGGSSAASSTPVTGTEGPVPILREVSPGPVAGGWFVSGATATSAPSIRYMLRENGSVTETPADSLATTRLSNTTVPGVEELYAVASSTVLIRYLNTNETLQNALGTLHTSAAEQALMLSSLPPFNRVAVGSDGSMVTVTEENGGSVVERTKLDGSGAKTLLASPIASWVPLAGGTNTFVETAPSAAAVGYVYEIVSGTLQKIAGGLPGLTASVSPSGRYVAVSGNGANGFTFFVFDTKTGAILPVPVHATTLKCAWIPPYEPLLFCAVPATVSSAPFPDAWLLGGSTTADQAWVVDPTKNTAYVVGALADQNSNAIDAENVSVGPTGSYALFMNKNDLSLWSLNIADIVSRARGQ